MGRRLSGAAGQVMGDSLTAVDRCDVTARDQ